MWIPREDVFEYTGLMNIASQSNDCFSPAMSDYQTMIEMGENNLNSNSLTNSRWRIFVKANTFKFKKGDAVGYLVFYLLIPIIITTISLIENEQSGTENSIYCYMTILISSLNAMYDGGNRWINGKSPQNIKIFIIFLSNIIVSTYCIVMILGMLILNDKHFFQCDQLFLAYIGSVCVTLFDIVACFMKDMALSSYIKEGNV